MASSEHRMAAALAAAAAGLRIVILNDHNGDPAKRKAPVGRDWGLKATDDEETIIRRLEKRPGANIGVLLGKYPAGSKIPGVIDVEFDTPDGRATADKLFGDRCFTPTYKSVRSIHRLFRWNDDFPPTQKVYVDGLEVRLGGDQKQTQSVLPPSTHDSGVDYAWLPGLSIDEVDLMEVPAILAAQFANVETRLEAEGLSSAAGGGSRKPDEHWDSIKDGVAEGGRNEALTSLVGRWLSNMVEIDVNDVKERAVNWGRKCSPPLPERECLAVVRSIVGKERRRRAAEDDGYDIPAVPAASIPAIPSVASVAANSPAPAAASAAMPQPQGDDLMSCELVVVEGDPTYFRFRCTAVSEKWVELSDWAPPLAAMKRAFFKATLQPLPAAIAAKWKRFPDRLAKARQVVQADSSTDAICIVAREIVVALQRHAMEYESFDSIDPSLMFHTVRFIVGGTSYIHGDELFQRLRGDTQLPEITRPRVYRVLSDCGAEHVTVRIGSPEKNIKRRLWRAPQPAIDRISSIGLGE